MQINGCLGLGIKGQREIGSDCYRVSFQDNENALTLIVAIVTQLGDYTKNRHTIQFKRGDYVQCEFYLNKTYIEEQTRWQTVFGPRAIVCHPLVYRMPGIVLDAENMKHTLLWGAQCSSKDCCQTPRSHNRSFKGKRQEREEGTGSSRVLWAVMSSEFFF